MGRTHTQAAAVMREISPAMAAGGGYTDSSMEPTT
jgi:hypothetical protein